MPGRVLMAPSILSADFTRLGDAVTLMEAAGADLIHVDVMDGHFVPNLTIGPPVVKALKRATRLPLDVHLMISNAEKSVQWYLDAGADLVTVHVEACDHLHRVLQTIRAAGAQAGVSLNPGTPVECLREVISAVDLVLVMSVNPGFGGQAFIEESIDKISRISRMISEARSGARIAVDGGIDVTTAPRVVSAGASMLIAGSAVFCADDPSAALADIRRSAESRIV